MNAGSTSIQKCVQATDSFEKQNLAVFCVILLSQPQGLNKEDSCQQVVFELTTSDLMESNNYFGKRRPNTL